MTWLRKEKWLALLEVLLVYGLIIALWRLSEWTNWAEWDKKYFGWSSGLKVLMLIFAPMGILKAIGRSPGKYGVRFTPVGYQVKICLLTLGILSPFYSVFPILLHYGYSLTGRESAPILSFVFLAGLVAIGLVLRKSPPREERPAGAVEMSVFLVWVTLMLVLTAATLTKPSRLAAITYLLVATGFGEEIFFRGYIQSRLNSAFGRRFCTWNTSWGWGLVITSLLFGIIHAFNPIGTPWWSVWTFFAGLLFGFLREKTGSIAVPAIAHGLPLAIAGILR